MKLIFYFHIPLPLTKADLLLKTLQPKSHFYHIMAWYSFTHSQIKFQKKFLRRLWPSCFSAPGKAGTLPAEMFGGSDFWLETRVIIKISKKMIPHMKPKVFFIRKKQNKNFFLKKKKIQNGQLEISIGKFQIRWKKVHTPPWMQQGFCWHISKVSGSLWFVAVISLMVI